MNMLSAGRDYFPEWRNSGHREHARGNSGPSRLLRDLNRNEVRILALMARGHRSKEIAARLGLAEGTVNNYRASIRSKLGVRTHAEIREAARAAGLLDPPDGH
ncbi:MAG: helix-turn-helix transcriptional regulator [Gemmatimonadetes bacterium]|nr:helix-turn-helix transcriptional regulator [Gemmatimonadota bacterium]